MQQGLNPWLQGERPARKALSHEDSYILTSSPSEVPTRRRSARISSDPSSAPEGRLTPASRLQGVLLDAEEAQSRDAAASYAELEA
jgi:hypothetical protein